jgi:hypothetical protein
LTGTFQFKTIIEEETVMAGIDTCNITDIYVAGLGESQHSYLSRPTLKNIRRN